MGLQEEIEKRRKEIRTDAYTMSIGEWINLYENGELDIHPEFQRFFRWTPYQKSRLIESILLGIPIPQIFVSQRKDGVWDVVDGLQRLSTIFQFVGILKDEKQELIPPLRLEKTKNLPSMAGKLWENDDDPKNALTIAQRLLVKRSKIGASIILQESDDTAKFELFQRLNTGGSPLSDQEVRNSILVMLNPDVYHWIRNLSLNENFKECVSLTDKALEEQYDMDLVLRFVLFRTIKIIDLKKIGDLNDFLTERMIKIVNDSLIDTEKEKVAFDATFRILRNTLGNSSFHKYDHDKQRFQGGFLLSAYELIALGIGHNFHKLEDKGEQITAVVKELWRDPEYLNYSGTGVRASSRLPKTIPLGRKSFDIN